MRRKYLLALIVIVAAFCNTVLAFADGTQKIYGDNVECKSGDVVEYTVNISGNPGVAAYLVGVVCESDWFYFDDEVTQGDFTDEGTITAKNDVRFMNVSWYNTDDVTGDGVLFSFSIHVSPSTPSGDYPIVIMYSEENTVDSSCNEIPFETIDGNITVEHADVKADADISANKGGIDVTWLIAGGAVLASAAVVVILIKSKK